jgi:CO/xanthine dehydrogenase FAD-binding subunit
MPIACAFEYHKPADLARACEILGRYGKNAAVLAGGTDLLVWMKEGVRSPQAVVDVKGIGALHRLEVHDEALIVGACVTFTELLESGVVRNQLPLLWECSHSMASVGVRNRATLAGNICSAVPCLDGAPALLNYEADVLLESADGGRQIPLREWFLGPRRTAMREGEMVAAIGIPIPQRKNGACYVKLGRYRGEDLAQVGVGILALEGHEYRVAFCAVGPVPTRASKIEALLNGHPLTEEAVRAAQRLLPEEISPITDIRASQEYRMHMARIMLARGLAAAAARLAGGGPPYGESVI